eukprot:1176553-Prorocentrum_minimum.AAC.9
METPRNAKKCGIVDLPQHQLSWLVYLAMSCAMFKVLRSQESAAYLPNRSWPDSLHPPSPPPNLRGIQSSTTPCPRTKST